MHSIDPPSAVSKTGFYIIEEIRLVFRGQCHTTATARIGEPSRPAKLSVKPMCPSRVFVPVLMKELGGATAVADRLRLLKGWPLLGESAEVDRLADLLIARHLLSAKAAADAQHVALAATAGVDYLLTWNCKHIANADLLPALYETLRAEGFPPPLIVTPEEFSDAG
jgi:hypothetical protein